MVPNENDAWKSLAMVAKETDTEKLSKIAIRFKLILSKKRAPEPTVSDKPV
jgi:hypothetical protein